MGKSRFISKNDFALSTALGIEFALIMCLGAFGGFWLDKKLNTFPWFLLVGSMVSFGFALFVLITHAKAATRLTKNTQEDKK